MLLCSAAAEPGEAPVFVHATSANLRAGPGERNRKVTSAGIGVACHVLQRQQDGWWQVDCGAAGAGWARAELFDQSPPDPAQLTNAFNLSNDPRERLTLALRILALRPQDSDASFRARQAFFAAELAALRRDAEPAGGRAVWDLGCSKGAQVRTCITEALREPRNVAQVIQMEGDSVVCATLLRGGVMSVVRGTAVAADSGKSVTLLVGATWRAPAGVLAAALWGWAGTPANLFMEVRHPATPEHVERLGPDAASSRAAAWVSEDLSRGKQSAPLQLVITHGTEDDTRVVAEGSWVSDVAIKSEGTEFPLAGWRVGVTAPAPLKTLGRNTWAVPTPFHRVATPSGATRDQVLDKLSSTRGAQAAELLQDLRQSRPVALISSTGVFRVSLVAVEGSSRVTLDTVDILPPQ
ncbi:MAG: hypothetical protein HY904_26350 [Deltaproteobacteria bacterium]|nr:hypothetical protein [Deltaproteobacteria bacterium]